MAKLHFKYGAMNSGKSDTLIKTAFNYEERGLSTLTVKPAVDTKGDDWVVARAGSRRRVDLLVEEGEDLRRMIHDAAAQLSSPLACILVDESQFLTSAQIDQLFLVAKLDDISVICYGLRTDFRTAQFPGSSRLFEVADNFEKLPTMCRCGSQAEFNCRSVGGRFVFEGDQVAIDSGAGGTVTYESLCGRCYLQERSRAAGPAMF
ncbi:thymidine kinase [Helcobacillus massiliensis]|uniref:Thymidine kinase n=1 Tax=Helcobacillus massiliensis TaxID=521392 RepID=A0A839QUU3_9MICO|nr:MULTISPECIES: thymidine kinase [Helcobacillus]MBB3022550.1 thymidine kinase [Helcobacillus massiliensis]MCG7426602.1 thymidine kinase [Helcobacillus sp. ACRRO]MCT1557184.1 thymidine kinase [Helcobacillus massiliensis]MCT2036081.1 thymidine kinase [Helcobacillus massiliensis]MCT2331212.1 thymidine kinase [Helcobacillus massiliensis]